MEIYITAVVSILVGLIVGILSGMLGIGGGTILVPTFRIGFAMSAIQSTATSLFTIVPTSIAGIVTHIRNKTCLPKLGIAAGFGGAIMSPVGVWLATQSPEIAILIAAAIVIAYSAITMFQKAIKLYRKNKATAAKLTTSSMAAESASDTSSKAVASELSSIPTAAESATDNLPATDRQNITIGGRTIAIGFGIGLLAGVLSGYVGVGGGFLMIPLFMQILHIPMKLTSGTSLIAVMFIAIPGAITQAMYGNIDWIAGIFVAIGTIPGAIIGAKLMTRIPEVTLRFFFSFFLLIAAVLLVINH